MNTSISREYFTEKGNASKDTKNVSNGGYVTLIQVMQAGNRIRDHLYWKTRHHFRLNYHFFLAERSFYKGVVCSNKSSLQVKQDSILDIQNVYWSRFASFKKPCQSRGAQFVWVKRLVVLLAQASRFNPTCDWIIRIMNSNEMKPFIVLCFTLCLEGSCKGMLVCNTFSFTF